jgi:hypothetical protein
MFLSAFISEADMKLVTCALSAVLLTAAAYAAQAQGVQIGPRGVEVNPYPGYGASGPGPCQGLQREARQTRERLTATANPAERARLQGRLGEIREQQARCGR